MSLLDIETHVLGFFCGLKSIFGMRFDLLEVNTAKIDFTHRNDLSNLHYQT